MDSGVILTGLLQHHWSYNIVKDTSKPNVTQIVDFMNFSGPTRISLERVGNGHLYTRPELGLSSCACPTAFMCRRLDHLFSSQSPRRADGCGCRAGQMIQRPIAVITSYKHWHTNEITTSLVKTGIINPQPPFVHSRMRCHSNFQAQRLRAGLLNISSINNKLDNVEDLLNDYQLNHLNLTKKRHENTDCVVIKRLRSLGLNVIDAMRPISNSTRQDNIDLVNHGGIMED